MFRQVIVGVDGGPSGRDAVALARLLTAPEGRLALAHVYELTPVRGASSAYGPAEDEQSLRLLEAERAVTGVDAELIPITASSVGRGLHYLAERENADLLSVGSTTRSLAGRVLVGDITRAALIGAPCAVAIAPLGYASDAGVIAKVGVGYDGTPESEAALAVARDLAARHQAALSALTVVEPSVYPGIARGASRSTASERELEQARNDLAALGGLEGEVAYGLPGEELAAFSARVDLLVVGSRGYGPIRSLMLGGTAVQLASNAHCPLLVLPRRADPPSGSAVRHSTPSSE